MSDTFDLPVRSPLSRARRAAAFLVCALGVAVPALGQEDPGAGAAAGGSGRVLHLGQAPDPVTPLGSVRSFVRAARRGDWDDAARYLDLEDLTPAERKARGPTLAWQLKVVLDRALPIPYELLSRQPGGSPDDGLPPGVERLGRVGETEILLVRATEHDRWVFAAGTVAALPELYERHGYGTLGEHLPAPMFETSFLDLQLWQWIGLLLIALAAYLVAWPMAWIVRRALRAFVSRTASDVDDRLLGRLIAPLRLLGTVALFSVGSYALALPLRAHDLLGRVALGVGVLAVTWVVVRTIDIFSGLLQARLEESGRRSAVAVLPLARRGLKLFLLAVAFVALLQNVGFNVAGLVAGLGIGGLAIALAAQKSIANLFGGVSLIVDQPIRVGEFCRFGDGKTGTVEEIGLRSTRIRTLDRTLVTIPNGEFSEIQLENFGVRDRMRIYAVIGLRYETAPDQLRWLLAELRKLLIAHPRITDSPSRVRFVGFGAHSLDVEIFAYVETSVWDDYLKVREDVYLRMMEIVGRSGTGFAFPSQTLYLGRDSGLDDERGRAAEEVRAWRDRDELPFPDHEESFVQEHRRTLDYPPRGSAPKAPDDAS